MTAPICVRCERPMPDQAYACVTCRDRALRDLLGDDSRDDRPGLVDTAPAARDIAQGQASGHGEGGASGKPESRLPLDLAVTAKLDAVQGTLTKWIDRIAVQRGTTRPWFTQQGEPITLAAHWLVPHLEWTRHQPDREPDTQGNTWGARQFLTDIESCARVIRGIVRGPSEQRFLGPCGAVLAEKAEPCPRDCSCRSGPRTALSEACVACSCFTVCHPTVDTNAEGQTCEGDVYARDGGSTGRCRTCGAEVSTAERQAWLDAEVRSRAFRASEIEDAFKVKANLIRQWATPARGLVRIHGHDTQGRALYLLSEVLEIAAKQAVKRAEGQARRARSVSP